MRDANNPCLFCTPRDVTRENALAYATCDSFPVSPGHTLVIPRRHCADFFDLTPDEQLHAGGQSVLHVHIHLIPRYAGDHPSPQGGVRQIIPWRADYPRGV